MIYTIGYQKLSLDRLVSILDEKRIAVLVDVRSVPYSRKPAFNRNNLTRRFGPRYAWFGDVLGGKHGPVTDQGIEKLLEMSDQLPVLVMCMEDDPCDCHRYQDIGVRLLEKGIDLIHLFNEKELRTSELLSICGGRKLW